MSNKTKLELSWIGKENRPRLEPRILLEDPEKSYHAAHRVTDHDLFDNRLIFGDNLLALKALEQEFTGRVKCVGPPGPGRASTRCGPPERGGRGRGPCWRSSPKSVLAEQSDEGAAG